MRSSAGYGTTKYPCEQHDLPAKHLSTPSHGAASVHHWHVFVIQSQRIGHPQETRARLSLLDAGDRDTDAIHVRAGQPNLPRAFRFHSFVEYLGAGHCAKRIPRGAQRQCAASQEQHDRPVFWRTHRRRLFRDCTRAFFAPMAARIKDM